MRYIKLSIRNRGDWYLRRASEDGFLAEIQNQRAGIIVSRPKVKLTLRGVILYDDDGYDPPINQVFDDRSNGGFEKNKYTISKYWR